MYYEDVKVKKGETVSGIGADYGYKASEWHHIWGDPKNAALVRRRGKPEHLQIDDVLWVKIPWHTVSRQLTAAAGGANFLVQRNGQAGKRMSWVQTVYRDNQPIGPNLSKFCVDACTPDDDKPFYWTDAEISAPPQWVKDFSGDPKVQLSKTFADEASRGAPTAAMGTTKWRAIVSIAVVTEKRVTVYDSWVWGFDLTTANVSTKVGPRTATAHERSGHLQLLTAGLGASWILDLATKLGTTVDGKVLSLLGFGFGAQGWTFRSPP
jgi:hypothetical protein